MLRVLKGRTIISCKVRGSRQPVTTNDYSGPCFRDTNEKAGHWPGFFITTAVVPDHFPEPEREEVWYR